MAKGFFSVDELERTKFDVMPFKGDWLKSLGRPEKAGCWIIYGESYHGKTNFTVKLAKYLTEFVKHKVLINSLEEGKTESFRLTSRRSNLSQVKEKILLGNRVPMDGVAERLLKQRSPEVIIIDSIQFTDLNKKKFNDLIEKFPHKLFIFISNADGKKPRGALAKHVKNAAMIKIRVEGFKAFPESRFGGGEPYIIDAERAAIYHGEIK
jgi:hypothetical protein